MATRRRPVIVDRDGVRGRMMELHVRGLEKPVAAVELARGVRVAVPFELLEPHEDGGYSIAARWQDFANIASDGTSIPVIAERPVVEIRQAPERRVRVRRRVISESRIVETPLWRERVDVERVPVGMFVDRAPAPHRDGDTWIVPCVEEVVTVEKRLRVTEELRIRVVRERHVDRQTVTLRRHEVEVEPEPVSETPEKKQEGDHS
jgi:uncharacterized protein (TIGR02271 family)